MSSKPWYPWYPGDYRAKTSHLDFLRDAAYRRLLDIYYQHGGPLLNDRVGLFRAVGAVSEEEQRAVIAVLFEFFKVDEAFVTNPSAEEHIAKMDRFVAAQSRRGKAGADARWHSHKHEKVNGTSNANANAQAMLGDSQPHSHSHSQTTKTSSSPGGDGLFDVFWKAYPKKIGKAAALKAWWKIRPSESLAAKIVAAVALQRRSEAWRKDGGQYIPHPTTWLNQGRWDDESGIVVSEVASRACVRCGVSGSLVETQDGPLCMEHWNAR